MSVPRSRPTAPTFAPGSLTLPGSYYTSQAVFEEEVERIGLTQWHCVGRVERITNPGDFFTQVVAGESLIILRDRNGDLRAHFNVCRHRGTRLCDQESGRFSETIQCPYHAWTYTTDGRLIGAPHMQELPGFSKASFGLHQSRIAEWDGFIFVNLDPDAPPLDKAFAPLIERLGRFRLGSLRSIRRSRYEVRSNWKLIYQNYSECLHCPTIHPELACRVPYQSGVNDLTEGPFLGGFMDIAEGQESVTLSGRRAARYIGDGAKEDRRRSWYYTAMPNLVLSIHPDYANYYLIWPIAPDRTVIDSEWLFHPAAADDSDFNPDDAVAIWDVTNRQDWRIIEESLAGIKSRRYQPGPYSTSEDLLAAWDRNYLRTMGR